METCVLKLSLEERLTTAEQTTDARRLGLLGHKDTLTLQVLDVQVAHGCVSTFAQTH